MLEVKFLILKLFFFSGEHAPEFFESAHCTPDLCTLVRGQPFGGRAAIYPLERFDILTIFLRTTVFGVNFPMPIPDGYDDACKFLEGGASCPITPFNRYVWAVEFPVDLMYPPVNNLVVQC